MESAMSGGEIDDPRQLRGLIERVSELADRHQVSSVIVGLKATDGDPIFPDFVEFLRSALRVEDAVHRMMRERAVLYLADVEVEAARGILERLAQEFASEVPAVVDPSFEMSYFAVRPGMGDLRVRDVLTEVFPARTLH